MPLIIGMNSGSSFDGIDVVLAETDIADDGFPTPLCFYLVLVSYGLEKLKRSF